VFFKRKTVWWPTLWGWLLLLALVVAPPILFLWKGEPFLAVTHRQPPDILVLEGWIGREGVKAAAREFQDGGYRYVVTNGGYTSEGAGQMWNFAEVSGRHLVQLGIPQDRVLIAKSGPGEDHRTLNSAWAVRRTLEENSINPTSINLFTRGVHARRSGLVNSKVQTIPVGTIAWVPASYTKKPWWTSSGRAKDFLVESFAYFFEALLNSGRTSNAASDQAKQP
jgi:hypothetical protein